MTGIWQLEGKKESFEKLLTDARHKLEELLIIKKKDYTNFMLPYQSIFAEIHEQFTPISHLNSVNNSEESQDIYNSCLEKLTVFYTEVSQSEEVFNAINAIDPEPLPAPKRRLLEILKKDFILEGVNLSKDKRARIKEINLTLNRLSTDYFQNILNDTKKIEFRIKDRSILGDMPEKDLATYFKDGEYVFNLTAPSYSTFIKYCEDESLREDIYRAYFNRADGNGKIIEDILALRKEKALMLGFKDYVELSMFTKTAKNGDEVIAFLENLIEKSKNYIIKDKKRLEEASVKYGFGELKPHNVAYIMEKIRRYELGLNEDEVRSYFEQMHCINQLLGIIGDIFNITFKPTTEETWHECVKVYDLTENGRTIGKLYVDLEARIGKRDGAWMDEWYTRYKRPTGEIVYPRAFIVGNFPPTKGDVPSMLRHSDIETLFHEMGHAIHHLLSRSEDYFISGINGVEFDVIEFPSQFVENFAFEYDVLKNLGKHIDTGELIPDELIEKLQKERSFFAAYQISRQIEFGLFDLLIHRDAYKEDEVMEILKYARQKAMSLEQPDYVKFQNQFTHIFAGGYAAGYYSYKWAEVLSADLFIQYKEESEAKAKQAAVEIFSKGGSVNIYDEYIRVMGKKPDPASILKIYRIQ